MNFHLCVLDLSIPEIQVIEACAGSHPEAVALSRSWQDSVAELVERGYISVVGLDPGGRYVVAISRVNLVAIERDSEVAIAARPEWPLMEPG